MLGHQNTKAFVSHCAIHSVYEAMFHGVPVVGVPFMFEQVSVWRFLVFLGGKGSPPGEPWGRGGVSS